MPKLNIKNLVAAQKIYKEYTKTRYAIGEQSIQERAQIREQTVFQFINERFQELIEKQKDANKEQLKSKLGAQTSEDTIKDKAIDSFLNSEDKKAELAANALAFWYSMQKESKGNQKELQQAKETLKNTFGITEEQITAFHGVMLNSSLGHVAFENYALEENGDFKKQLTQKEIEDRLAKENKQKEIREKDINNLINDISYNEKTIKSFDEGKAKQFAEHIKGKMSYGYTIFPGDIIRADRDAKMVLENPESNEVPRNEETGEYDYQNFFNSIEEDRKQHINDTINKKSEEMGKNVYNNIKGELKTGTINFNMVALGNSETEVINTTLNDNREIFRANLSNYFLKNKQWKDKSILSIIRHPFDSYKQYKDVQNLRSDFMNKFGVSEKEMKNIDKFQANNKGIDSKSNTAVNTEGISDFKIEYDNTGNRLESQEAIKTFKEQEKTLRDNLRKEEYYDKLNEASIGLKKESIETQIKNYITKRIEQFNQKHTDNPLKDNEVTVKKESNKDIGAKD